MDSSGIIKVSLNIYKIENIIQKIISDETRHIAYTSRLIENAINDGNGDFVRKMLDIRMEEFNIVTYEEAEGKQLYSMS